MKKETKHSLKVIQEADASPPASTVGTPTSETAAPEATSPARTPEEQGKKAPFELPDGYLLAQEMKDIFDEDIVTHVQGESEPEAD